MSIVVADRTGRQLGRVLARQVEHVSDRQLLLSYVGTGDQRAFAEIVRRHGPVVYGVCRRALRDPGDVEDAFQACFLVLVRKARSLRDAGQLGSWLYGVARRVAREVLRMTARRLRLEGQASRRTEATAGGEHSDLTAILDEELARLPDHYRLPVVLCLMEGVPRKVAARQMRVPLGTVSSRLTMAKQLLATRLRRRGLAVSATTLGTMLGREAVAEVPGHLHAKAVALTMAPASATVNKAASAVLKAFLVTKLLPGSAVMSVVILLLAGFNWSWAADTTSVPGEPRVELAIEPLDQNKIANGNLTGTVVDPTGKPVAGAKVWCANYDSTLVETKSDEAGRFRLEGVPGRAGIRLALYVEAGEWARTYINGPLVYPGRDHDVGMVRLHPGRRARGQVLDVDGAAKADVEVEFIANRYELGHTFTNLGASVRVKTDAQGRFVSPPLPVSCVHIFIRVPERATVERSFSLAPGEGFCEVPAIKLVADTPYEIKVTNQSGEPVPGVTLTGLYGLREPTSDASGVIRVRGYVKMPSVLYRLQAKGYPQMELLIQDRVTNVTLKKPTHLTGTLVDAETGKPVPVRSVGICQLRQERDGSLKPFG
jgi:RNA polymerase sigma factor (sigma-70 family)